MKENPKIKTDCDVLPELKRRWYLIPKEERDELLEKISNIDESDFHPVKVVKKENNIEDNGTPTKP